MLKFKPSEKIKRRYILFDHGTKNEVEKIILDYLGILGWAKAGCVFVENKERKIILSVSSKEINNVRAAFEIAKTNIKIGRVSGTLKGLMRRNI